MQFCSTYTLIDLNNNNNNTSNKGKYSYRALFLCYSYIALFSLLPFFIVCYKPGNTFFIIFTLPSVVVSFTH